MPFRDVSAAFLHARLDQEEEELIFVVPPATEIPSDNPGLLWRLRKALYGLRVAPRKFTEHLAEVLQSLGWRRSQVEPQLSCHDNGIMSVDMDHVLMAAPSDTLDQPASAIATKLKMKWGKNLGSDWEKSWATNGVVLMEQFNAEYRRGTTPGYYRNGSSPSVRLRLVLLQHLRRRPKASSC